MYFKIYCTQRNVFGFKIFVTKFLVVKNHKRRYYFKQFIDHLKFTILILGCKGKWIWRKEYWNKEKNDTPDTALKSLEHEHEQIFAGKFSFSINVGLKSYK